MHPLLKRQVERALSSRSVARATRHRVRGKRLVLAYHGIVPAGAEPAGERALFLSERTFAEHLEMLGEVADVAPLNRLDEEGDARPRVAITFDDAYGGAVQQGVHELTRRGMPATIFVVPDRLDGHAFWWDALSHERETLDAAVRDHALNRLEGSGDRVRQWAAKLHLPVSEKLPQFARPATLEELRTVRSFPAISIGSHSWSHRNLNSLDDAELVSDLQRSRDWIHAEFGVQAVNWLAYPYGLDSARVQRGAAIAGYSGAVRISGGWHRSADVSAFARPRLNIPSGMSTAGLRARVLGAVRA